MNNPDKKPNSLIQETSPYLLQHAYNPVNWMPWGEEALELAKQENKPILVSIGYSACHWCHVMEHESFEDSVVAKIMNENFICIKVDREERPDIDQIYMTAVQLMTGRGGWPLNCFTTPEGKPFYGGTYFPKEDWTKLLKQLIDLYQTQPDKVAEYANKLTEGVQSSELIIKESNKVELNTKILEPAIEKWQSNFDLVDGGNNYAPKFPIPNNYEFLLHYGFQNNNTPILNHVERTLQKMAYGGIYDQIGGGFARYSTDMKWKAPHFEKMLYDNAQLISLYSKAYQLNPDPLYKQIVFETIAFCNRELRSEEGIYYSALDADSEGEEGKYYVWTKTELEQALADDFKFAEAYFNINSKGLWEHGNYILLRDKDNDKLASKFKLDANEFVDKIEAIKLKLLSIREKRIKPGLDDKSLCSWNGLMIKALAEAYLSFHEDDFLNEAIRTSDFIKNNLVKSDRGLFHSYKNGEKKINGFLEDYSFMIEAYIALYQATFNEKYLNEAKQLIEYAIDHFYDHESGMFFFTSIDDSKLIARKTEITDNVIPSSNSSIAISLHKLGLIFENEKYKQMSTQMLTNVNQDLDSYLSSYSNWATLLLIQTKPYYEIAIVGNDAREKTKELYSSYNPNSLVLGSIQSSDLPLLKNKLVEGQTTIYVCENKVCQLPVTETKKAIQQLQK